MKPILLILFLAGIVIPVFAIEFYIAPLYFIDETIEHVIAQNDFHERLLRELGNAVTGTELRFRNTGSFRYNPPQSVGDAIILCRSIQAEYLIYGYITRKDLTIQGELRLLDYEQRDVIAHFFAMDSSDREDELIKDLADKLFRFVKETYNIIVIPNPPAFTHVQFPVSLGYWQPLDKNWINLLFGTARIKGGIQLIPSDNVFNAAGYSHYISVGVDISYQLGRGNNYPAWDHGFNMSLPVLLHRQLNEQHEIYAGLGLMYTFDMLRIQKPYEDPVTELYSAAGVMVSGGWFFRFKERLFIFAELRTELRFYDKPMLNLSPSVGIIFRRYTQEVVKKW